MTLGKKIIAIRIYGRENVTKLTNITDHNSRIKRLAKNSVGRKK